MTQKIFGQNTGASVKGANLNFKEREGKTPLHLAKQIYAQGKQRNFEGLQQERFLKLIMESVIQQR
jgi:hypothetical protein